MPKLVDNQFTVKSDAKVVRHEVLVTYIEPGSPADKAGLKKGDQIVGVGSIACDIPDDDKDICTPINKPSDLTNETHAFEDLPLKIEYRRDGKTHITTAQLRSNEEVEKSKKTDNPKGYLGVSPSEYKLERYTWSAPVVAVGLLKQFTVLTFQGLGTAISSLFHGDTQKASEQVSGPIGIFEVLRQGTLLGIQYILLIIAIISLSLAIMNVLPIPALDGGRLFVMLVSRLILKRPLTKEVEEAIHGLGFMFLIGLLILISIVDVNRFF
jgi:regulator of sigma E protease